MHAVNYESFEGENFLRVLQNFNKLQKFSPTNFNVKAKPRKVHLHFEWTVSSLKVLSFTVYACS